MPFPTRLPRARYFQRDSAVNEQQFERPEAPASTGP
jgi:hypothetical protein